MFRKIGDNMDIISLKKYIFTQNKIPVILADLGCSKIKYNEYQKYYSAAQPDGDNPCGIVIYADEYLRYVSYSRNIGFDEYADIINLVEQIKNIKFLEAFKYLHKLLNLKFSRTRVCQKNKEDTDPLTIFKQIGFQKFDVSKIHSMSESVMNDYVPLLHIDWYREGIMPKTAKKFGIAYSYRQKRIIIPHRLWCTGELIGINARTTIPYADLLGIKKYYITPSYRKSLNIYGLWEHYKSIKEAGYVVVVEGEKSVLKRDSLQDETLVAISGKVLSDEQVRILIGLDVDIVIAFDKDVSDAEIYFACQKFYKIRNVSYIKDQWDILGDKDSPADAKNSDYQFLFNHRQQYTEKQQLLFTRKG